MTAIIGIQCKDGAVLAADSRTTYDDRAYHSPSIEKIIEKSGYAFAFAGDGAAANVAKHLWMLPRLPKTANVDDFVMTKLLPTLRDACNKHGYTPDKSDANSGFQALIIVNGVIYQIDHEYDYVQDDTGHYAIGSAGKIGLGVLHALAKPTMKTTEALPLAKKAIEASIKYDLSAGGNITSLAMKKKVVTER